MKKRHYLAMVMKICSANLYYNTTSAKEPPTDFLERMPLLRDVPAALASAGHGVSVVQLYPSAASFTLGGVDYHFVKPTVLEKSWARAASWMDGRTWTRHVPATSAIRRALGLQPDVVHFHRLTLSTTLYLMQLLRGKYGPALVGQYHGGRLTKGWLLHRFQKSGLSQLQSALFAHKSDAEPFVREGLLLEEQIVVVPERSTRLSMRSRGEARRESGMVGAPVFLWHANLTPERDPMTAVLGFERLLGSWPKAQLFMYYGNDEMLPQLRAYVVAHPELAPHVHFRGRVAGQTQDAIFNSADFLLQTDLTANNGHAVLEAMACGVIPVVSDIPVFRTMVDNGRCGFLFQPGDPAMLAKQILKFSPEKIAGRAALVHNWFEEAYSYDALAGLWLDIYTEAIGARRAQMELLSQPVAEGSR